VEGRHSAKAAKRTSGYPAPFEGIPALKAADTTDDINIFPVRHCLPPFSKNRVQPHKLVVLLVVSKEAVEIYIILFQ